MIWYGVRALLRWLMVPAAVAAAYYVALYVGFFGVILGPFPKDLAEPTAGALLPALVTLAGAFAAPRYHVATAVVLAATSVALSVSGYWPRYDRGASVVGGIVGVALVAWWRRARRRPLGATHMRRVLAGIGLCVVNLVVMRYVDWPERPDEIAIALRQAVGSTSGITAFRAYDLGGFIDREWLWRFDGTDDAVARVVRALQLRPAVSVPAQFWRMPPYYWPRSRPTDVLAYQSDAFTADGRGRDGQHFFLVYDRRRRRVFVWFKDNF